MAFAKPFIPLNKEHKPTENIFIYIDNSFSMDAENQNGNLLAQAKEKARSICKSYPSESNFWLITNDFLPIHNNNYNANAIGQQIDNIQSSCILKSISEILNRQQTVVDDNSHLYIISDMQKSTIRLDKINQIDSSVTLFLISVTAQQQSNLSIDSAWINSPLLTTEKEIEIFVNLSNNSEIDIKKKVVFLNINGKPKSQQFVNLKANERKKIDFNFTTAIKTDIIGEIIINDPPIAFDNKLYFTIKRNEKINIFCINQEAENKALNTLFLQDTTLFYYQNFNLNNINYNSIIKQDLVILNQIQELSSGLLNTLNKIITIGGSILVIPPSIVDIAKYNHLLKQLGLNTITTIINEEIEISNINIEHPIFNSVFEGRVDEIHYPIATQYFVINNSKDNTPLLSFENKKIFLSIYKKGKGLVYQLNSPLDNNLNNFSKHALFVPTLLNIATQSVRSNNIYNNIGSKNYFTSNYKNNKKELLHLKNAAVDIIPTTKISEGKTYYYTHNQITENGIYNLTNNSETIEAIAFNYNTNESNIEPLSTVEIKDWIAKNNLSNVHIISSSLEKFKQVLNQQQNGKEFWKITLILSLLFFATEILLIKLLKS